jgi:hypothetical protein
MQERLRLIVVNDGALLDTIIDDRQQWSSLLLIDVRIALCLLLLLMMMRSDGSLEACGR